MAGEVCDVCGGVAVAVTSSAVGAISYAYCAHCAVEGLEPWDAVVALIFVTGEDLAPWAVDLVERCLKAHNKTREDLARDVRYLEEGVNREFD